jgi:hypothetical protein
MGGRAPANNTMAPSPLPLISSARDQAAQHHIQPSHHQTRDFLPTSSRSKSHSGLFFFVVFLGYVGREFQKVGKKGHCDPQYPPENLPDPPKNPQKPNLKNQFLMPKIRF